jgi:hypothetical protein
MFRPMTPTTMVGPTTPTTQEQSIPQERRITSPLPAAGLTPPATPDNIGLPLGHPTSTQPPEASGLVAAPPRAGPPTGLVGPQVATPPISRSPTLNTWSDSQSETQIQTETEDESVSGSHCYYDYLINQVALITSSRLLSRLKLSLCSRLARSKIS